MYKSREFSKEEKKVKFKLHTKIEYVYDSVMKCLPEGRERSIVLSHLEDAALHIGVAIAANGITKEALK